MSDRPALIFHHPLPVEDDPRVGSTTHVTRMRDGFVAAGYDVEVVAGYSRDRLRAMRRIRQQIRDGRHFEFLFAEASTAPTAMNDPHHVPLRPVMDWRFLRFAKGQGIPVGLFYPDVYWRFPLYRSAVPTVKRWIATALYRYDLAWYRRVLDVLFLPSVPMREWVPGWEHHGEVLGLPPGGVGPALEPLPVDGTIRLFYVGSVDAPLYDISPLLAAVQEVEGVELTICCPHSTPAVDAAAAAATPRITIVHEHGDAVRARYAAAHAACLVFADEPYRSFAMPVKLFEAIAAGRPVLASVGTSVAAFVESTATGWVTGAEVAATLRELVEHPRRIAEATERVRDARSDHTWAERARFVSEALSGCSTPVVNR